jgi:hypothetical protein
VHVRRFTFTFSLPTSIFLNPSFVPKTGGASSFQAFKPNVYSLLLPAPNSVHGANAKSLDRRKSSQKSSTPSFPVLRRLTPLPHLVLGSHMLSISSLPEILPPAAQ